MKMTPRVELGLAIFLVLIFVIPIGLTIFVAGEVPYRVISGEPVKEAAQLSGISVISAQDTQWNPTGAIGGKTYVLGDISGNTVTVETQSFDSAESRDAAIRLYNVHPVGKGRPAGSLIVIGHQLVFVTPAISILLERIAPHLQKAITPWSTRETRGFSPFLFSRCPVQ